MGRSPPARLEDGQWTRKVGWPMRRLAIPLVFVSALVLGGSHVASAQQGTPPPPKSMAAIGDSITQAANVCCWYGDHPANSWSTGGAGWDAVTSHFERLRAVSPDITGHNVARSGARMSDAPAQAQQ